jgi:hypothetical protein
LINNAKSIDKTIFDSNYWDFLEVLDVLTLRVFSPSGVFISLNKEKYTSIINNSQLLALSECLFKNDRDFISNLPLELKPYLAQLEVLMDLAYKTKIRR